MLVEHYYSSPQVERFRIKGKNDREVLMEKRLNVNKQQWKVSGIINTNDIKEAAMAVRDTQDQIDYYLQARETNPQNEGYMSIEEVRKELDKKRKKW